MVKIESSIAVGKASIFYWWFCWWWCCIINNQPFGSFYACWLLDLLTFWRAHGFWHSYSTSDGVLAWRYYLYIHCHCHLHWYNLLTLQIINSLSKNQWISLLLKERGLQIKSKHATSFSMIEKRISFKLFVLKLFSSLVTQLHLANWQTWGHLKANRDRVPPESGCIQTLRQIKWRRITLQMFFLQLFQVVLEWNCLRRGKQ